MYSSRKRRMSRQRSASGGGGGEYSRPSAARRLLLLDLSRNQLTEPEVETPARVFAMPSGDEPSPAHVFAMPSSSEPPPREKSPVNVINEAQVVHRTPGGSLRVTGDSVAIEKTPSGRIHAVEEVEVMTVKDHFAMPSSSKPPPREKSPVNVINEAQVVHRTPGGSLRVTGDSVAIEKTPSGRIHAVEEVEVMTVKDHLLDNPIERLDGDFEADDEESVQALLDQQPWHVRNWLLNMPGRECSSIRPNKFSGSAEANVASGIVSICPVANSSHTIDDVRPSTSGMVSARPPLNLPGPNEGSELDSEFDDSAPNPAAFPDREIPDDEDLDEPVRQLVQDIERAMDDEIDRLPGVSTSFDWTADFESFGAVPENFSGPTPGPVRDYDTPYDAFTDIWSMDFIERIVQETNRYAKQTIDSLKAAGTLKPSSRLHSWSDTDADEIMVFLAVLMYMGIDPRTSQYEYWKSDDFLEMPKFKTLLTYSRYILLNKFLHFVDNSDVSQNSQQNEVVYSRKLAKLVPVISHLSNKFASLYNLQKNIAIDESLTLFKGRLSWVQTIRTKAARFGIKSYELCESQTGYLFKFMIYTGKQNSGVPDSTDVALSADLGGKTTKIVVDLLEGISHRGHLVTMDNFYNSPALARYLKTLGFDCLGTLRSNRRNVPTDVAKISKKVSKGTIVARHCGDVSVLAWKDSKVVTMISTYHNSDTFVGSKAGKVLVKPKSVGDYNKTMGGIDLKDQKLSMYLLERKRGLKWYVKMFKRLLNISIHNAFIMTVTSLRRRDKLPMTHREFRYALAKSLALKHRRSTPEIPLQVSEQLRLRKDIVHVPKYAGRSDRKSCAVCYGKGIRKMVCSQCVTCGEYLCFEDCWSDWHSLAMIKEKDTRGRKRKRNEN